MSKRLDTQWDRIEALLGDNIAKLKDAKIAIVGLGSLGSSIAQMMAMSGFRDFILIDMDILEPHNIVRHAAGLSFLDYPKVLAVENLIKDRNASANVDAFQQNVFDTTDALDEADVVVVAGLGSEIATSRLSSILRSKNKVAFYGGLYEKAIAGEVFVVHPSIGPCYACFARILRETEPEVDYDFDYGLPADEVSAQPGLGIHVFRVSIVLVDWVLRYFIRDPQILPFFPGNLAILSNESYTLGTDSEGRPISIGPSSSYWLNIQPDHECLICSAELAGYNQTQSIDELLSE